MTELEAMFEAARDLYPGDKDGFAREWREFHNIPAIKKYKMKPSDIVPLLLPAIQYQIDWRVRAAKLDFWTPNWKGFHSWLHNEYWDRQMQVLESEPKRRVQTCMFCNNPSTVRMDSKGARCSSPECKAKLNAM